MGDLNQLNFIKNNKKIIKSPILEVGSKDYGNTPDIRSIFLKHDYVGIDMEDGKGVDLVLDLTRNNSYIQNKLGNKKFKTVICFSVLEHCQYPFKMAENITKLLDKNGILFISVPFSWRIHGYPSDYWRFTPDGIRALFPNFDFEKYQGNLSSNIRGEVRPIDNYMLRAELDINKGLQLKRYGHLTAFFIRFCRFFKIFTAAFGYPYVFPPVMINMIGVKK